MRVLRVGRISFLVIIFSFVLPVIVTLINPPQFIDQKDLKDLSFEVPQEINVTERKNFVYLTFRSPFGEEKVPEKKKSDLAIEFLIPNVTMVYRGKEAYMVVQNEIKKEGDSYSDLIVERILHDKILFRTKKGGKKIWVNLSQ